MWWIRAPVSASESFLLVMTTGGDVLNGSVRGGGLCVRDGCFGYPISDSSPVRLTRTMVQTRKKLILKL